MYVLVHIISLSLAVLAASGAPQAGTIGGSVCQFPFVYKDVTYTVCTTKDDPEGKPWCSTGTDNRNNHLKGKFKHCQGSRSSVCQFPFIYKGVTYTACTTKDDPDGKPWCSTQTDSNKNHLKGKFKQCQGSRSSVCQFPFIYKGVTYTACTTKDDPDGLPWCSTQTDSNKNHLKGKFKSCQGSTSPVCQFPFIHKDVSYTSCTTKDDPDGKLWCSTQTDKQNNHIKGKFKHCQASPLKTGTASLLPSQCGAVGDGDRIIGGTELPMQSFRWIAVIGVKQPTISPSWDCGGSLISQRYVVTAAHCHSTHFPIVQVRLGEHDLSKTQDCQAGVCAPPVQDFNPEQIIPHPKYNTRSTHSDDILLIRLDRPAGFTNYVRPICLPPLDLNVGAFLNGREAEVAGWGYINLHEKSDVKRVVKVPYENMEKCLGFKNAGIHGGQLCFGGVKGKDSCSGDSGGPLVNTDLDGANSYVLLGVVSYGPDPCGQNRPAVYTDVGHYRNWIVNNLQP